ncbi:MAG: thioredoxin domain-containing protein [Nanoarchaeota archaeon]|nr:thioredoxin domain-containing protein [Nanoarchaeota archaeon]MBU1643535.1 thioredoxin domain-containing protein [Nanoarchaeota archaeon]MBU1977379.1 thioredoxin domain-containing protein [Nanoarchaeota archaeon]
MEQKQLDEIEESYFGEEFIEEETFNVDDLLEKKAEEKMEKLTKTKKTPTKKNASKKNEKQASVKKVAEKQKEEVKTMTTDEEEYVEIKPVKESAAPKAKKEEQFFTEKKEEKISSVAPVDPWAEEEEGTGMFKEASTWKAVTAVVLVLLIFSVFTQGFRFSDEETANDITASISLSDAENKVLNYVNNQLLQPPFEAVVENSAELDSLYLITLSVAGQEVDSYITKDGALFFPQGFKVNEQLAEVESNEAETDLEVSVDNDAILGDENAPVTIVEFSDFQCPYCGKAYENLKPLEKEYIDTGKVRLVFRDFPLSFHLEAESAAMAAECAHEQGKFWEYHNTLFENQAELGTDKYIKWAGDLGLDVAQFEECVKSQKYLNEVAEDFVDGQKYGVSGTPAFFINGKLISGAQPYSVFKEEIETALAKAPVQEQAVDVAEEPEVVEVVAEDAVEEVEAVKAAEEPVVKEEVVAGKKVALKLEAKKWLFTPETLTVNKGDQVELTVNPSGLDFTFKIADLGVETEVSGATTITFTADKSGSFEFKCGSCEDWRGMTGTLTVK